MIHKNCGCIKGIISLVDTQVEGLASLATPLLQGNLAMANTAVQGSYALVTPILQGAVTAVDTRVVGVVSFVCTPGTDFYLDVTPDTVWMLPDDSAYFDIITNTSWEID